MQSRKHIMMTAMAAAMASIGHHMSVAVAPAQPKNRKKDIPLSVQHEKMFKAQQKRERKAKLKEKRHGKVKQ